MLQDFQSVSDHFETFCMKGLSGIGFAQINYGKYQVTLKPFGEISFYKRAG